MQAAKNIQNVMSKVNAFETQRQEYDRQGLVSKEPEFVKMKTPGIQLLPKGAQESGLGEGVSWRNSQGFEEEHEHRLR